MGEKRSVLFLCSLMVSFQRVMSVMAGLNNAAISRLKEDWALVSNEKMSSFRAIEKLLDPSRNFRFVLDGKKNNIFFFFFFFFFFCCRFDLFF